MSENYNDDFDFGEDDFFETPKESNKGVNMSGRSGEKTTSVVPDPSKTVQKPKKKVEKTSPKQSKKVQPRQVQQIVPDEIQEPIMEIKEKKVKGNKKPKKKSATKIVIVAILLLVVLLVGVKVVLGNKQEPAVVDYNNSGKAVFNSLQTALNNYKAEDIDKLVGTKDGDSYLAQEWGYANSNPSREKFILKATSIVKFKYPQVEQLDTKGGVMLDANNNPIMIESPMNNGESVKVTVLDYKSIGDKMQSDVETIETMLVEKGITKDDYDYQNDCIDLMLDYILKQTDLPTVQKDLKLQVSGKAFKNDVELDKLLFSSEDFHYMCDSFDKIVTGYKPTETQEYYAEEEVHNDEYDNWYKLFKKYYNKDKGKFKKGVSKWEPWYKRDNKNKFILGKNGKKIVNYYSVKDKNGNDWIQPSKTIFKKVKKTKEVPVTYIAEKGVTHCFLGAYYCQNEYDGLVNADVKVGDGTDKHPAGVGTPVITKVLCKDGKYHDVRVTMKGYWVGEDAITYAGTFSEKNRGFDPRSVVQLICYEIEVENLEKNPITFDSEMVLCDKNSNQSPRTGTMYEFSNENITVDGKQSKVMNDWATSTEINQKFVIWGKSFNRQYSTVYFKVLGGTGNIPTYSAYKAFTGESSMSGSSDVKALATPTPVPTPTPMPTSSDGTYDESN